MCSIGSGGGSGERGGAAPAGRAVVAPGAGADCCCAAADAARLPATRNARTILVFISRLPCRTIPVPRRHVRLSISWGLVRRLGETHNRAEGAQPCDT